MLQQTNLDEIGNAVYGLHMDTQAFEEILELLDGGENLNDKHYHSTMHLWTPNMSLPEKGIDVHNHFWWLETLTKSSIIQNLIEVIAMLSAKKCNRFPGRGTPDYSFMKVHNEVHSANYNLCSQGRATSIMEKEMMAGDFHMRTQFFERQVDETSLDNLTKCTHASAPSYYALPLLGKEVFEEKLQNKNRKPGSPKYNKLKGRKIKRYPSLSCKMPKYILENGITENDLTMSESRETCYPPLEKESDQFANRQESLELSNVNNYEFQMQHSTVTEVLEIPKLEQLCKRLFDFRGSTNVEENSTENMKIAVNPQNTSEQISDRCHMKKKRLFDCSNFDTALEAIFPLQQLDYSGGDNGNAACKYKWTPPKIKYCDERDALRFSQYLHDNLSGNKKNREQLTLPTDIPVLRSYDIMYVQTEKGCYRQLGWRGCSCVFLGYDRKKNCYVTIKIKPFPVAIKEARLMMYLYKAGNIPQFYGILRMNDDTKLGVVCEYINMEISSLNDMESKDIYSLLIHSSKHKFKSAWYLTKYQWLDVCIAICKIVEKVHEKDVIINDLTCHNILLRREGTCWLPYVVNLSLAQTIYEEEFNSFSNIDKTIGIASANAYRKHLAPEFVQGVCYTKQTDIYSLVFLINYVMSQIGLELLKEIEPGLSHNPDERPSVKDIMHALICLRVKHEHHYPL